MAKEKDPDWYRFHFKDWTISEAVTQMTMEQVGCYITLLAYQMSSNTHDLPDDVGALANFCRMNPRKFLTRVWKRAKGHHLADKFKEVPGKPGRLHNERCSEVIEIGKQALNQKKAAGTSSYEKRVARAQEEARLSSELTPAPDYKDVEVTEDEYAAVVREFPKRTEWREGLEEGERLMRDTITTRDQFSLFVAAVRRYKRECSRPGHNKKYTMKFDNFMFKWRQFVPDSALRAAQPPSSLESSPAEPPASKGRVLAVGEDWPWELDRSPAGVEASASLWPEARRRAYMDGEQV